MTHIPPDFHSVTPFLCLADAEGFLAFVQAAFGAQIRMVHRHEGRVQHAEFSVEGSVLELGEARPGAPSRPVALHVFVPDVDAAFARALAAGGTQTHPVTTHNYGERSGGIQDAWGNDWYVATMTDVVARTATE